MRSRDIAWDIIKEAVKQWNITFSFKVVLRRAPGILAYCFNREAYIYGDFDSVMEMIDEYIVATVMAEGISHELLHILCDVKGVDLAEEDVAVMSRHFARKYAERRYKKSVTKEQIIEWIRTVQRAHYEVYGDIAFRFSHIVVSSPDPITLAQRANSFWHKYRSEYGWTETEFSFAGFE